VPRRILVFLASIACISGLTACTSPKVVSFGPGKCAPVSAYRAPCGSLGIALRGLRANTVLKLQPGTYDIGKMRVDNVSGTAAQRVIIKAADTSRPPLLRGWLSLWSAHYVTLDHVQFQATETTSNNGGPAGGLSFTCGVGWAVTHSKFFGAKNTGSLWNLGIGGTAVTQPSGCVDEPRGFLVGGNTFKDAYVTPNDPSQSVYHHIYAFFEGTPGTSGSITRNLFVGARNGAGIKLGAPTKYAARNVRVTYNTFYNDLRAVVLEEVKGTVLCGNLTDRIIGGGGLSGKNLSVALGATDPRANPRNTIAHTYAADNTNTHVPKLIWGPVLSDFPNANLVNLGDNVIRSGGDPQWTSTNPDAAYTFTPTNSAAKPYGARGTGSFC
jgi:hypothetical protein